MAFESGSFSVSGGQSQQQSGEQYTPQQQSTLNWLHPYLQQRTGYFGRRGIGALQTELGGAAPTYGFPTINQGGVYSPQDKQAEYNRILSWGPSVGQGDVRDIASQFGIRGGTQNPGFLQAASNRSALDLALSQDAATKWLSGANAANRQAQLQGQGLAGQTAAQANQAERAKWELAAQSYLGEQGGVTNALLAALGMITRPLFSSKGQSSQSAISRSQAESTPDVSSGGGGPSAFVDALMQGYY